MQKLRLAFMGTPEFSVPALKTLAEAGHEITAVYSQPPKPAGRGQQVQKSPVHRAAEKMGFTVRTPKTLRDAEEQKSFTDLRLDACVVVAYGLILPPPILTAPKYGCLNIHASLLPRWRGAAPIQRAILAGDPETGITIMRMDAGLDTGPVLLKKSVPITSSTTAPSLHDALAPAGAKLVLQALEELAMGKIEAEAQPASGVTYAFKLAREDGRIDWAKPAAEIERQVRALTPWPGCFFTLDNEPVKVLKAETIADKTGASGTLLDDQLTVACGQGAVRLLSVQKPGKNATGGADFLRGSRLEAGHKFS